MYEEYSMTSTKLMLLGILIMLLGLALVSVATRFVWVRTGGGIEDLIGLAYIAVALFAIGFMVGVFGFFRPSN
jgi:hypothetical protein